MMTYGDQAVDQVVTVSGQNATGTREGAQSRLITNKMVVYDEKQ